MKLNSKLSLMGLLALGLATLPMSAADESSRQGASFDGKVTSVNKDAQTVVVGGETYQLLPTTRVTKGDQVAAVGDLAVGQQVDGRYKRSAEGKREVLNLDITKASAAVGGTSERSSSESGATFNGEVDRVGAANQTLRIGQRTYHILPTTRITRAIGDPMTFSDIKKDQYVSGTYKESAEGRLEVLTLEVGRGQNQNKNRNR
ncbi:MAG TPA: DUF5666 domain-containing protein [Verrucomicrobiae bacterium]|nr:DUF5666 domain-containing protein [Verrucomicrobiae bacterium]